jgi:hypothetical protein
MVGVGHDLESGINLPTFWIKPKFQNSQSFSKMSCYYET